MAYQFMKGAKVYTIINNIVHKFCKHCEQPTPILWNEQTKHIKKLIFRQNPNLGKRMATGAIDARNPICFPRIKKVPMCASCVELLANVARTTPAGRTPFLENDNV